MKRLIKLNNGFNLSVGEIFVNANYVYRTINNIQDRYLSYSHGEPLEIWINENGENILINGYHRLIEGIIRGYSNFDVQYINYDEENKEYIDEYDPSLYDQLDDNKPFKGLENEIDLNLLNKLRIELEKTNE